MLNALELSIGIGDNMDFERGDRDKTIKKVVKEELKPQRTN
jgi:hypothetical protein